MINPDIYPAIKYQLITPTMVQRIVSEATGITYEQMCDKTRRRDICEARQLTMYFLRKTSNRSYKQIGRIFGKDHATVIHACKSIKVLKEVDKRIKKIYDSIDSVLIK